MITQTGNDFSDVETSDNIRFTDIFDLGEIQKLQDLFADANGVASIITHPDGTPITNPSNFCRLCENIIRKTEKGIANCMKSDAIIGRQNLEGPIVQPCLSCSLWDAGTSITVGGKHIANWLIGQVRNEEMDIKSLLLYADDIGVNRKEYVDALKDVPVMSVEQFKKVANLLFVFANELSEKAYKNLQMKRQLAELEKAKRLNKESEESFGLILENMPILLNAFDENGNFISWNKACEITTGYKAEEIINNPEAFKILYPDPNYREKVWNASQEKNSKDKTFELTAKNGEIKTIKWFDIYQKLPLTGWDSWGLGQDITQSMKFEQELLKAKEKAEASEKEFKLIIESQVEGIGFINKDEIFVFTNSASEKIFETEAGELIGVSIYDFLDTDETEKINKEITERQNGIASTYEIKIKTRKGNTKYINISATPKFDENNSYLGAYGVVRDITLQKQAELLSNQQFHFTKALNEIAELIVSNDNTNNLLEESNRIIGETLKLDRSLIYEISFEKKYIFGLCEWLKEIHPDIEPTRNTYPLEMFLSPFTEIKNTKKPLISHFDQINEIFEKDESAKTLHHHFKIKSLIWYPFAFSNQGYYLFTLNQILKKRDWTTAEIDFLESAAKQLSLALMKIKLLEEKELAEEKIRGSEEKYRLIAENTSDGILFLNAENYISYTSPTYLKQLGYSKEEEMGRTSDSIYSLIHPEERDDLFAILFKAIELKENGKTYTYRAKHKNGEYIWREDNVKFKYDATGNYQGAYIVCRDITERKNAENELNKQILFRQFLTEIASAYINLSIDDMEVEINNSLAKIGEFVNTDRTYIFDFDAVTEMCSNTYEWCAKGIEPQIDELQNIPLGKDWIETFALGNPITVPDVNALPDGYTKEILQPQGIKSCLAIPMMNRGKCIGFVGFDSVKQHYIFSDAEIQLLNIYTQMMANILLRKQNEEDLIEATQKAVESDKLKTSFLNNISHEIRTPFNGILGFLNLIQEDDLTKEERNEYFNIINKSADRLMKTIFDIVEISQIQADQIKLKVSETDINKITEELYNQFLPEASDKRLALIIDKTAINSTIKTDGTKLKTIFSILIDNAIKFTKSGSITYGCYQLQSPDQSSLFNDSSLHFYVKDTGIGIPHDKHQKIFERFMQVDVSDTREFEGSGLGLSIVKSYIEMLGGSIWLESEPSKGTVFYFSIPSMEQEEKEVIEKPIIKYNNKNQLTDLKILIVEDDLASELYIFNMMQKFSKHFIKTKTGTDAIEICINNPDINLIFMDIRLPEMDGFEATRMIRQFNKEVIIVAQTAFAQTGDKEKALLAGCNDYISKPIRKQNLMDLLKKYFKI
jgi:PAS domain S-box-containing protein